MSEQNENTEHRIREALLAEAGDAPAPSDLWARVESRLERPAAPMTGWQRRLRMAAMGAAVAVVLAVGGAGTALISAGLSSGDGDPVTLAFSANDGPLSGTDGDTIVLSNPDRHARVKLSAGVFTDTPIPAPAPGAAPAPTGTPAPQGALGLSGWQMTDIGLETSPPSSGNPQGFAGERQIISRASLDVEVSDVSAATTQLRGLVESLGGFIEHVSTSGGPNPEYGSAVVRVPGDRFLGALDRIERLGKAVGQSLGQQDVTGEAIDLEARLKSERSTEQSLLKLLDRAVSVSDVLTVERELSRVRANVERLQGQLEFIQRSVALATITVSFMLPPGSTPVAPSASIQVEVGDVERPVSRIRDLVGGVGGTMGQVIIRTRQHSQEAFLSFLVPASAFDGVLTALAGEGVVLHREVQSDGRLRQDGQDDDLQGRVTVQLQTPDNSGLWRSIGGPAAGGLLVLISVAGALALVFRARRRRA